LHDDVRSKHRIDVQQHRGLVVRHLHDVQDDQAAEQQHHHVHEHGGVPGLVADSLQVVVRRHEAAQQQHASEKQLELVLQHRQQHQAANGKQRPEPEESDHAVLVVVGQLVGC